MRRELTIRWTAGVDRPRSVISHSSNLNHSVGRANASVPIRTRRVVPSRRSDRLVQVHAQAAELPLDVHHGADRYPVRPREVEAGLLALVL